MPQIENSSNTVEREALNWLFTAHFSDETTLEQTLEDRCLTRDDGTGSAFTDVLAREDDLIAFELTNQETNESIMVDLKSGNFVVNGVPVCAHNQNFEPQNYPLKLVYFRETRVERVIDGKGEHVSSRHFVNRYFIGWETVVNGKNKQATLAVG